MKTRAFEGFNVYNDKGTTFNEPGRKIYIYSKPFTTPFSHPPCPKPLLYPFGGVNLVFLDSIDPLDSTRRPRLPSLDTIFTLYDAASSSTSCTTQPHRVRRILHSSYCTAPFVGYNTASSSPSCTAQLRRVHLTLHDSKARGFVKVKRAASRGGGGA